MARFRKSRPTTLMAVLAALALLLLSGCGEDVPLNTFEPRSDAADSILTIYIIVITTAAIVGAGVLIAMVWMIIKYRARPGRAARQIHGNSKLELAWTIAPILVLMVIAFPTMFWIARASDDAGPNGLQVTAIGHQWWFEFRYPGLGPLDANGDPTDLITANELHVPIGRGVAITLESDDVIHSFWVPRLVGKTDMIPNRTNKLEVFEPNEIGVFSGQCVEFCGSAHALMRFRVHVDSLGDFNRWVNSLNTPPQPPEAGSTEARGELAFQIGCSRCHTISGTSSQGRVGPDLTGFGGRGTLAAGVAENDDETLRGWIGDVRSIKPIPDDGGVRFMPTFAGTGLMTEQEISDVAAYLRSLTID